MSIFQLILKLNQETAKLKTLLYANTYRIQHQKYFGEMHCYVFKGINSTLTNAALLSKSSDRHKNK